MKKEIMTVPPKILVGITARTSNQLESDPSTASIGKTIGQYCAQNRGVLSSIVQENENLKVMQENLYSVYTEYESDKNGIYTFFVGNEINSLEFIEDLRAAGFHVLQTRAQKYAKFTSDLGKMPDVCIALWRYIWGLSDEELGGKRSYATDFEIYETNNFDPTNASVQIYIGIENL